jgi:NAD(P)-dependent dehydrogenase (short-subunit alcohol dehydrogenase family)
VSSAVASLRIADKVVIVTGGANGIGRALCRRFAREGATTVVVADLDADAAELVATEIAGTAIAADVSREADVVRLVDLVLAQHGRIDLFCSNAGIAVDGDEQTPTSEWDRCWDVNVMAHVYAARAVVPGMLARGGGYLLQTVSAAGLLTHIQSATYAVTKHAALAFAEWLSMAYGDRGIIVSALCPQGVRTDMLRRAASGGRTFLLDSALEPEQVADDVVKGLAAERFLILPHAEVTEYVRRKATDYDRWLRGMRKLRQQNL